MFVVIVNRNNADKGPPAPAPARPIWTNAPTPYPYFSYTPFPTPVYNHPHSHYTTPAPFPVITTSPTTESQLLSPIPPSPGYPFCSVCGPGLAITLPGVMVNIPTKNPTTCASLQNAGELGFIEPQFCPLLTGAASPCGCAPIVPSSSCDVCTGKVATVSNSHNSTNNNTTMMTNTDQIIVVPGEGNVTCGDIKARGDQGLIDPQNCSSLPTLVAPCGCMGGQ